MEDANAGESNTGAAGGEATADARSIDARLALFNEAWPSLPEPIRATIVAMVETIKRT
jgi:hypothetical protein